MTKHINKIHYNQAIAIEQFVLNVTILIFAETNKGLESYTGTLFKIEGRRFIITSRHIFDKAPENLLFSENILNGRSLLHSFSYDLTKPDIKHFDIAILEIRDSETLKILDKNFQFLSLQNVALPSEIKSGRTCILAGYPSALIQQKDSGSSVRFISVYTERIPVPKNPELPVIENIDLFFGYKGQPKSISDKDIELPKLPGTSGASIWEYHTTSGIWTAESTIRVVGVQSTYTLGGYFRAKSWAVVKEAFTLLIDNQPLTRSVSY